MYLRHTIKKHYTHILLCLLSIIVATPPAFSGNEPPPPIPDLTKPNGWRPSSPKEADYYNLGPTGMMGIFKGPGKSNQIFVDHIAKGSPVDGMILRGDVLLAVNGTRFKKGDNLIVLIGNAIIEAEKTENKGKITFTVWRDENWPKRTAEIDVTTVTVDDILADNREDDDGFADWKTEEQQKKSVAKEYVKTYEKFPMIASTNEITLTLETLGTFSPTAPFDCTKTEAIIAKAYPHIVKEATKKRKRDKGLASGWRSGTVGLALLASGNSEHVELVKASVHKSKELMDSSLPANKGWGTSAWFSGYRLVFLAEYYLRTDDKTILPGLHRAALLVARNQAYGGTWGHSGHNRGGNFGKLHGPATGYGAMNQAAGPCFYGLTLAQKAGLNDPEVDEAVRRSVQFYATYVDKGCVPYGYHEPGMHEDSNGKNGPPALAMKMVGQTYNAKYYSLASAIASSWGYRGGHGDGTFGNYWCPLASGISGKTAVATWMKKMHPWYTMLRRFDGSWVSVQSGSAGGLGGQFNNTSMYMLHLTMPRAQLYMTGRDPAPAIQATDRDIMHLEDRINGDWRKLTTDQIISKLDTISNELRNSTKKGYPSELIKRFKAGENDIDTKLLKLVNHKNHRTREAALRTLSNLGKAPSKKALPYAILALKDPSEIVRMAAVSTIGIANSEWVEEEERNKRKGLVTIDLDNVINPLFEAALTRFEYETHDTYNTPFFLQNLMINSNNLFAKAPFGQGYEPEKVAEVLEQFLTLDPRSGITNGPSKFWDRDTVVRMAGPIAFVSENFPMNGVMFGGSAPKGGQQLLIRHKFIEAFETGAMDCLKVSRVHHEWQPRVNATPLGWCSPNAIIEHKGMGKTMLPWMRRVLIERPNTETKYMVGRDKRYMLLTDSIRMIEANETPKGWRSLKEAAMKAYLAEVDGKGEKDAQVAFCRTTLDPTRKTYFRQLAAMDRLVEILGSDAAKDLIPYIGHDHWRFQDHSRALMMKLKGDSIIKALVQAAASKDDSVAAAALIMLGTRGDKEGVVTGLKYIASHKSALVRGSAAQAIYGGSKGAELNRVLDHMKNATESIERDGFEKALLMLKEDNGNVSAAEVAIKKMILKCSLPVRHSLCYVLGQYGGPTNLAYLKSRTNTEDEQEFTDILDAISYSTDIAATKTLVELLNDYQGTLKAFPVSKASVKRLINGGKEIGKVPDPVNLDFAEAHLKVVKSQEVLSYLGNIKGARCMNLLFKYMKAGPAEVTETAAEALVRSASRMTKDQPLAERKAAAEILSSVMEYINVVQTRGDVENVSLKQAGNYAKYKKLADKAGLILKRIYSPEEEAIGIDGGGMDTDDLDL